MAKRIRNKNNDEFFILYLSMTTLMRMRLQLESINKGSNMTTTLRSILRKYIIEQKK
jgi:hypothetical protein